jgi:hypothetical protein
MDVIRTGYTSTNRAGYSKSTQIAKKGPAETFDFSHDATGFHPIPGAANVYRFEEACRWCSC